MPSYIRTRNEFAVNSFTAANQMAPAVSTFADGGFVVAWGTSDPTQDSSDGAIKAQLFDAAGNKVGMEFLVNDDESGYQFTAAVTTLDGGRFVVTWVTSGSVDGTDGIRARLFDQYGRPIGGEFGVNMMATGSLFAPNVAKLANGGFVISWDGGSDTRAQIFDSAGMPVGGEFRLNTSTDYAQEYGDIVGLAGGGFVATWRTTDALADGSGEAVKAQVFSATGAKVGAEFLVNSQKAGTQNSPAIAALADGGFVITWYNADTAQDGSGSAVKAQLFNASGVKVGGEVLVNSQTAESQTEPAVTATPDGGFVIAWTTRHSAQDGSGYAIKAQSFDSTGAKVGGEILVNTLSGGSQFNADLATLSDGRVVVTWQSETGDIEGYALRGQILGTQLAPPQPNTRPIIISNGGGTSVSLQHDEWVQAITTVVASDDGEPSNLRYSITDGDTNLFQIDAFTGVLRWITPPEFDPNGSNFYSVTVTASDGQLTGFQSIQLMVNHVNHIEIISDGGYDWAQISADENQTAVTTVTAVDEDGAALTYSITGGEDASFFTIDSLTGVLSFTAAPDYEEPQDAWRDNFYEVVITATDGTRSDTQIIGVVVENVLEDAGFAITSDGGDDRGQIVMPENSLAVTIVAAGGAAGPVTYAITGGYDAGLFTIDAATGALSFLSAPDYESPPGYPWGSHYSYFGGYQVVVGATDGISFDEQELKVVVEDIDEAPYFESWWGETHIDVMQSENEPLTMYVSAYDQDRYSWVTYGLEGADAALFQVDAYGMIGFSFAGGLDFEAPTDADGDNVYEFDVVATSGWLSSTQSFSFTIRDVNERPKIITNGGGSSASVSLDEGRTEVTTVIALDDGPNPVRYSITGGWSADLFRIDAVSGQLSFRAAPDYENPAEGSSNFYTVYVTADDGELSSFQMIQVMVNNLYEEVRFGEQAAFFEAAENGTAIGTTSAIADIGMTVQYAIAGGPDAAFFAIDPGTGSLSFVAPPNYEAASDSNGDNLYQVVVSGSDGTSTGLQYVTVMVMDVTETVEFVSFGAAEHVALTLGENSMWIGMVIAQDSAGHEVSYSIAGGADAAVFEVDPQTGELRFVYEDAPDFEAPGDADGDNVYDVVVSANSESGSDLQSFAVTIVNRNEGVFVTSNGGSYWASISVAESSRSVTTVTAFDPDGNVPTFLLAGTDASRFTIDAQTGVLTFIDSPDYEAPTDAGANNVYSISVAATDGDDIYWQDIQVRVTDVDDTIRIVSYNEADVAIHEVAEGETAAAQLEAVSPTGGAISYAITGGEDAALFAVDPLTGALRFIAGQDFELPADADGNNTYMVNVTASDGVSSDTQIFGLIVADVNEQVVITSNGGGASASLVANENQLAVTTVVAEDYDETFPTFAIVGGADAARFTIDSVTGVLQFVSAPNYEAPGDSGGDNVYDVVVRATDGSLFDDQVLAVTVASVDEGVTITSYIAQDNVSLAIAENGTAVGRVTAVDVDGDPVSYQIVGGADAALFRVDPVTGALSFASAPNFEAPADSDGDNVYKVQVAAISGAFTDTQAFSVAVYNANEPLVITSNGGGATASVSVGENGRTVTNVTSADPDGPAAHYSITGGADASRFTINSQTGLLEFVAAPDHETPGDSNGDNVYEVVIRAGDGQFADYQILSVGVLNLRDGNIVNGTTGGDSISGTSTNPALRTSNSEDTVSGRDGHDTILGLAGDDILAGDAGNDVLNGGAGADRLTGGIGKDQFVYNAVSESTPGGRDVITDFSRSQSDKISLSGVDANSVLSGNQAFTFIGSAAFSNVAGQLRYSTSGGITLVSGDVNGDGVADFQIELTGTLAPIASDFVL